MNQLKLLKRKEVNEKKWNELIMHSATSLPYAFTWYLDAVSENWEALVLNDYQAVMPLPWIRKFGFKCLHQPYYCQQLGFFSNDTLKTESMKQMLLAAGKFPYININLNPSAKPVAGEFQFTTKKNLLLDLDKPYSGIRKIYSENHRRNIVKAEKSKLGFFDDTGLKPFQKFYLENVNRAKENFKMEHEKSFKLLTKAVISNKTGQVFSARGADGKLLAAVLLVFHRNRTIGVINTSSTEGKKYGASHFLFDQIIQKFASGNPPRDAAGKKEEKRVLDFEGSSVPTIARFYEGFGAREEVFYNYHSTIIKKLSQRFL